jgi:hypothetical protein
VKNRKPAPAATTPTTISDFTSDPARNSRNTWPAAGDARQRQQPRGHPQTREGISSWHTHSRSHAARRAQTLTRRTPAKTERPINNRGPRWTLRNHDRPENHDARGTRE